MKVSHSNHVDILIIMCNKNLLLAASSAATADLEEAYHREMSERVRHKMATSQHLEPEDHDWMR